MTKKIKMTKSEIRKKYKLLRSYLSVEEIAQLSIKITDQLQDLAIWDKSYYHLFLPIKKFKEVETKYLFHRLQKKNKAVVASKSNFDLLTMRHFLLNTPAVISTNKFGIPEPEGGCELPAEVVEVIFVPLLAFDIHGNRVGYGKGFYDIFLSQCNPLALKIGLSFFDAELQIDDVNSNDVRLNFCVTPNQIYKF